MSQKMWLTAAICQAEIIWTSTTLDLYFSLQRCVAYEIIWMPQKALELRNCDLMENVRRQLGA